MNRKTRALEEKHLSPSSRKKTPRSYEKERISLALLNRTRECTEADIIKELNDNKHYYMPSNRGLWYASYRFIGASMGFPWEKERDIIIEAALEKARNNWDELVARLQNVKWEDFLESYALAEFRYRNSPLMKVLK